MSGMPDALLIFAAEPIRWALTASDEQFDSMLAAVQMVALRSPDRSISPPFHKKFTLSSAAKQGLIWTLLIIVPMPVLLCYLR